jgi:hypothetical protein
MSGSDKRRCLCRASTSLAWPISSHWSDWRTRSFRLGIHPCGRPMCRLCSSRSSASSTVRASFRCLLPFRTRFQSRLSPPLARSARSGGYPPRTLFLTLAAVAPPEGAHRLIGDCHNQRRPSSPQVDERDFQPALPTPSSGPIRPCGGALDSGPCVLRRSRPPSTSTRHSGLAAGLSASCGIVGDVRLVPHRMRFTIYGNSQAQQGL